MTPGLTPTEQIKRLTEKVINASNTLRAATNLARGNPCEENWALVGDKEQLLREAVAQLEEWITDPPSDDYDRMKT